MFRCHGADDASDTSFPDLCYTRSLFTSRILLNLQTFFESFVIECTKTESALSICYGMLMYLSYIGKML